MCTVFKTCFLSSRFTSLLPNQLSILSWSHSSFKIWSGLVLKLHHFYRDSMRERLGVFYMHQPVQSVYLSLVLGMAAKWSDLHFSLQTAFQASTFKIPGESAANQLENDSDVGLPPSGKELQKEYSLYFHIFAFVSLHKPVFLSYFAWLGKCSHVLNVFWQQ